MEAGGYRLSRKQVVLGNRRAVQFDTMMFDNGEDGEVDMDLDSHLLSTFIPKLVWEEFGSPEEITVTIEPGDKLNG